MANSEKNKITRKEFLKKSLTGLVTYNLLGESLTTSINKEETKQSSYEQRILGRTGIKVVPLGYGVSRTMEPSLLKSALDKGMNFFDTGRQYYNGQNEIMIGKVLKGVRQQVVIQSKVQVSIKERGEKQSNSEMSKRIRTTMESSLNESLKALQTDYIDIFLIHGASSVELINNQAVMEFFTQAKKKGAIRAYGFSTDSNQIEVIKAANENNFYEVVMVPYNYKGSYVHMLNKRYFEWNQPALEVELKKAYKNNIALIAMKTCSAGPYSPDGKTTPSYADALKWILNHDYIKAMAVAMASRNEMDENIRALT